jgi:hypothetical protein
VTGQDDGTETVKRDGYRVSTPSLSRTQSDPRLDCNATLGLGRNSKDRIAFDHRTLAHVTLKSALNTVFGDQMDGCELARRPGRHLLRPHPIVNGYRRGDGVDIWRWLRQIDRMELGRETVAPLETGLNAFNETGCWIGVLRPADSDFFLQSALPVPAA